MADKQFQAVCELAELQDSEPRGAEIEGELVWLIEFRGDKVVSVREFTERDGALKAAGLEE